VALTPKRIRGIFELIDNERRGFISKRAMKNAFKKEEIQIDDNELDDLFDMHDVNGDGQIDIKEFRGMFHS
jgi:Ca2+-binding EF-hand superfamily protein